MKEPEYIDCYCCGEFEKDYHCCMLMWLDKTAMCPYSFGVLCADVVKEEKDYPFNPDFHLNK